MTSLLKKKALKLSVSLLLIVNLMFVAGLTAMAASDDLVFDNYDRATLGDLAGAKVGAQWTGGDAGKSASIDGNALKLEYASKGWFGTGGGIDASGYKYLKLTIKGAAGGEGADFDLNYAVGENVKTTGKSFADLSGAKISTDYQDIYVDLAANKIDKGIQALHFNFHDGAPAGTIWIDSISFTNSKGAKADTPKADTPKADTPKADTPKADGATTTKEANPKTGDSSNMNLYGTLALMSGLAAILLIARARRAGRNS
ncbi:sortase B protein-sorting domain-containing protein [Cohnella endophytica]|uniref:Sortase B protein-sorting domain-containing protein n=1 Tax=Cohnella endophytica TaxID=2419778 RepID=A0A494Y5W6_9BACL|nr:sortase B protein-sorting domain-containing protein [Cohnella endophytica]RKP58070.1 sortase B protein-sorting domain-containing protein [Cohnella endophytica]